MKVLALLGLVAFVIALWWVAVATSRSLIFPTPWQVVLGIVELTQQGLLLKHVLASLLRATLGYLLAVALAIPLGILLGWFSGAYVACNLLIQLLRPISPIAWIPLAILWFGVGDSSPILLIFLSSFFPMVVETTAGVHTIGSISGPPRTSESTVSSSGAWSSFWPPYPRLSSGCGSAWE